MIDNVGRNRRYLSGVFGLGPANLRLGKRLEGKSHKCYEVGLKCYPHGVGRWGAPLTGGVAPAA